MIDFSLKSLITVSSLSLVAKISGVAAEFLLQVLLARLLGVTEYGIFIYIFTWVSVLAMISVVGMDTATIKFVSTYNANKDWNLLKGFIGRTLQIISLSGFCVAGLLLIILLLTARSESGEFWKLYLSAGILIPLIGLNRIKQSIFRGLKYVIRYEVSDNVIRPILFGVAVYLFYEINQKPPDAGVTLFYYLVVTMAVIVYGSKWIHGLLASKLSSIQPAYKTGVWIRVALPLFLVSGMQLVLGQTDIIMLGALVDTNNAGFYSAATRISVVVTFGLLSVNSILAPLIAELYASHNMEKLQKIILYSARIAFLFTLITSVILAMIGGWVLGWFGSEFTVAYKALLILLAGQMVNAYCGSVGVILTMTDNQNVAARIFTGCALLNIILNYLLIPRYGMEGAAISTACTIALLNILLLITVRKRLKLNPAII